MSAQLTSAGRQTIDRQPYLRKTTGCLYWQEKCLGMDFKTTTKGIFVMKQKIKIVLFLITLVGFPLAANAVYLGSTEDNWKDWSYSHDGGNNWFDELRHGKKPKGNFEKHESYFKGYALNGIKWHDFHGKAFDFRHIDLKWLHDDDHWLHELLDSFGWIFDGHGSKPHARVPEPAALVLLATGILLIAGIRKSR